jgi:hypothetical protein
MKKERLRDKRTKNSDIRNVKENKSNQDSTALQDRHLKIKPNTNTIL